MPQEGILQNTVFNTRLKFLSMSGKRKKVTVTMEKKLEALFRIDKGEPMKSVAIDFGVGTSTVSDWKKNRKEIENFCAKMVTRDSLGNRGTVKKAKNVTLDEALYMWYIQEREKGAPISGPMLRKKALSLNNNLGGDPTFTASVGWLGRWKARHGIKLTLSCENLLGDTTLNNNGDHQLLLDDNLVTVCLSTQDEVEMKEEGEELASLNHTEAVEMLQKLIKYFEHQSETLGSELMTLKHLHDRVSKKCLLTLKQEPTRDFVK
ncbi:jerky protein homolog-like [Colletes gigas]|uniref:jerky protein homolog-like n=1 Tax=Colletes gigas TaxID=935657 RepID=UPI001C9A76D7|nr:jerky protein homolog-like [Colletes gigas]